MKQFNLKFIAVMMVGFWLCSGAAAWGQGIKERMLQRQPEITRLKDQGIIGETNTGYLDFVTAKKVNADMIAQENKDRKAVYAHIAKKQNVSIDLVQKRRAKQIADRSQPGHYYQNESGAWVKH